MSSKSLYFGMLALIALLIIGLVGGTYETNRLLHNMSDQLVSKRTQIAQLSQEQSELGQAKAEIKHYQGLATIAQSIVPQDKDQAETVRQIADIASADGITLGSITFPGSSLGAPAGTGSPSPKLSQLTQVPGVSGVYTLQLTIQSDQNDPVSFGSFISFLSGLEHNRRTALVSSINIQPTQVASNALSFTLTLNEYIKP